VLHRQLMAWLRALIYLLDSFAHVCMTYACIYAILDADMRAYVKLAKACVVDQRVHSCAHMLHMFSGCHGSRKHPRLGCQLRTTRMREAHPPAFPALLMCFHSVPLFRKCESAKGFWRRLNKSTSKVTRPRPRTHTDTRARSISLSSPPPFSHKNTHMHTHPRTRTDHTVHLKLSGALCRHMQYAQEELNPKFTTLNTQPEGSN
jgi:hypothetical protein